MEELTKEELLVLLDAALSHHGNLQYIELRTEEGLKVFTKEQFETNSESGLVNSGMTLKVMIKKIT